MRSAMCSTRVRVLGLTSAKPFTARDTVWYDTPALRATSFSVTAPNEFLFVISIFSVNVHGPGGNPSHRKGRCQGLFASNMPSALDPAGFTGRPPLEIITC